MQQKLKILLTGGHGATTAIAVVEELSRRMAEKRLSIYWIGAKRAIEGKNVPTIESSIFPKLGVTSHSINAGRLQRKFNLWTIPSLAKVPLGFISAAYLLILIRPNIVLSFGGYAAFPVVFVAWLLGIPVVLHEQTIAAGLANKFSVPFAKKIALARSESIKYFPSAKVKVVGNPVRTQIARISPKVKISVPPTIFVTGGSRGAVTLNSLIEPIIGQILEKFHLIHQTGAIDFARFEKIKENISEPLREKYELYSQIDPLQISDIYKRTDLLVGRAGANTVSEIILLRLPSILIPIPFTYENEQTKNALFAKRVGVAEVISQDKATPQLLLAQIKRTIQNWDSMVANASKFPSLDKDASERLVNLVFEELHLK